MPGKTDVYEVDILKATTGQVTTILSTTPLANVYVALYTVTPGEGGGGTECTGGSYARVDSKGKWATPASGSVSNNAAITFPQATADWGTVVAFALMTTLTVGTMLMFGALTTSKTIANGDTASFASGALTLTED